MKMSKTQTGAKRGNQNPRNNWKKSHTALCVVVQDCAEQIKKLQQQLTEAQATNNRLEEIIEQAKNDLFESQTTRSQLNLVVQLIKKIYEKVRKFNPKFSEIPTENDYYRSLERLGIWFDDLLEDARDTKNSLADSQTEIKKREAVVAALTDIIQEGLRQ